MGYELGGSWQDVTEEYDAPPGEEIRIVYAIEVPWWLEWTPDYIMDFLVTNISGAWAEIQKAVVDFDATRYEIKIVETGKRYQIIIYGVSRGVVPWVAAAIILGLLIVVLIALTVVIDKVQRLVAPPGFEWAIPIAIVTIAGAALIIAVKK